MEVRKIGCNQFDCCTDHASKAKFKTGCSPSRPKIWADLETCLALRCCGIILFNLISMKIHTQYFPECGSSKHHKQFQHQKHGRTRSTFRGDKWASARGESLCPNARVPCGKWHWFTLIHWIQTVPSKPHQGTKVKLDVDVGFHNLQFPKIFNREA